jgi:flagellar basal body-associated protein FliL
LAERDNMNLTCKNKIKAAVISDRGSSSVLVILIMVMLVVLGLLALISTWSGLKLARKNASWTTTYYELDSLAENRLAEMDACLMEAEQSAEIYVMTKDYERPQSSYLPADIQHTVHDDWLMAQASGEGAEFTDKLQKKLYYIYSEMKLNECSDGEFEIIRVQESDGDTLKVYTAVYEEPPQSGRSLRVGIEALYRPSEDESDAERYRIISWKEIPKSFEYDESLEFEDIEIEDIGFGEIEIDDIEFGDIEIEELEDE